MIPTWLYWIVFVIVWLFVAVDLTLSWMRGIERYRTRRDSVALSNASFADRAEDFIYIISKRIGTTVIFLIVTVVFSLGPEGEKGVKPAHRFEGKQAASEAPEDGCVCDCGVDERDASDSLSLDHYEPAKQSMESFRDRVINREAAKDEH